MIRVLRLSGWFLLLLALPAALRAQPGPASIWYFGQHAGLDFRSGQPVPLSNGQTTEAAQSEGTASIADSAGNLLFYTDGQTVWNRRHQVMPNGTGLWGFNSSTHAALIVPQPGHPARYYIFTTDAQAGWRYNAPFRPGYCAYSVVELDRAGGLGDVVIKNRPLFAPSTEKLAGVHHANGRDFWVLTHEWESDAFRAYRLTGAGLDTVAVVSRAGAVHQDPPVLKSPALQNFGCAGQMKFSPDGRWVAVALANQ